MTDTTRQDAWLEVIRRLPADQPKAARHLHHWVMDSIRYQKDPKNHWQSPQETLRLGAGDCEDFAILWFASLRLYGLEPDQVRLAHIESPLGAHMVCIANLDEGATAFDNLQRGPEPWDTQDNRVVYMINESGAWVADELLATISRQWDRVLAELADLDGRFTVDLSGA